MDFGYYRDAMRNQMNDSWHIPRASLGGSTSGSSSNSSSKSNSNPPTVTRLNSRNLLRHQYRNDNDNDEFRNKQIFQNITATASTNLGLNNDNDKISTSPNDGMIKNSSKNHSNTNSRDGDIHNNLENYGKQPNGNGRKLSNFIMMKNFDDIKRGSRSSQGSTDSHSSSRSASSGSLLLTAANLERFVAIHNKSNLQQTKFNQLLRHNEGENYHQNITYSQNPLGQIDNDETDCTTTKIDKCITTISNDTNDIIVEIDPNLNFIKTKDVDTMSIASSTHFTMVNGVGGPQKKIQNGICSRGHQITVLILTMSSIFLIGILLMVYLMEMRAREMPQQ